MSGDPLDPDAIWKPGYQGAHRAPADHDIATATSRRRPRTPAVATAALAVLTVLAISTVLWAGGSRPSPARAWTVSLEAGWVAAVTSDDEHVLVLLARPASLVALDHATGEQRWRQSAPGAAATGLDVIDGVVITRHVEADADGRAAAFDVATGSPLWSLDLSSGERVDVVGGTVSLDRVRSSGSEPAGRTVLDLRTGDPTGASAVADRPGPNENLITRFGTATGLPRANVDTERGTVAVVVEPSAGTVTLSFVPTTG